MILNLDPQFTPFPESEQLQFESFTFPGGEPHLKIQSKLGSIKEVLITHRIGSFNDFGLLLLAIDALKRAKVEKLRIFLPYFPAARQDRVMVAGEAFSLKVYANLLNSCHLDEVIIFDPHSAVTPALLNNCTAISNHNFIAQVVQMLPDNLLLIAPDAGAIKKVYPLAKYLKKYQVIECSKVRDITTGNLSGFRVNSTDLNQRPCLIVDDICDGGGTFLGLAKELNNHNAGSLFLAISHGIFSKGLTVFEGTFQKIFTTDSIKNLNQTPFIQQIKLTNIL